MSEPSVRLCGRTRDRFHGTIAERDLFDTRLMGCVTPRPSEVVRKFWSLYAETPESGDGLLL